MSLAASSPCRWLDGTMTLNNQPQPVLLPQLLHV
jgi:hypothetical protein